MSSTKYQIFYDRARESRPDLFRAFKEVHDSYSAHPKKFEEQFHTEGIKVLDILRDAERRLCAGQMRGGYGAYSQGLSEKFWELVRKDFPLIDQVGVRKRIVKV